DETAFARARTLSDVARLIEAPQTVAPQYPYWRWTLWPPVRALRLFLLYCVAFPAFRTHVRVKTTGLENLPASGEPLLFVSNHESILDAPAIARALPARYRHKLAFAMGAQRAKWELYAGGLFFNTYPLPPTSVGLRDAMRHTGELVDRGFSPLVFPEGVRTKDGELLPFQPGIGVIAHQIGLRILPIRV